MRVLKKYVPGLALTALATVLSTVNFGLHREGFRTGKCLLER